MNIFLSNVINAPLRSALYIKVNHEVYATQKNFIPKNTIPKHFIPKNFIPYATPQIKPLNYSESNNIKEIIAPRKQNNKLARSQVTNLA